MTERETPTAMQVRRMAVGEMKVNWCNRPMLVAPVEFSKRSN